MITNRNGFGNDSHCVFLTHSSETISGTELPDGGYFYESSKSGENHLCNLSGVTVDSSSKFGDSCWNMTGSTTWKYIQVTGNTGGDDWHMGQKDFTIDFFIKLTDLPVSDFFGSNGVYLNGNNFWGIVYDNGRLIGDTSGLTFVVKVDGNNDVMVQWLPSGGDIITDIWYHFAITRKSDKFRMFWNGKLKETGTYGTPISPYNIPKFDVPYLIGTAMTTKTQSFINRLSAYYDEFRISKGICRWERDFTPPNREY